MLRYFIKCQSEGTQHEMSTIRFATSMVIAPSIVSDRKDAYETHRRST
jgi:hypothetical protein